MNYLFRNIEDMAFRGVRVGIELENRIYTWLFDCGNFSTAHLIHLCIRDAFGFFFDFTTEHDFVFHISQVECFMFATATYIIDFVLTIVKLIEDSKAVLHQQVRTGMQ